MPKKIEASLNWPETGLTGVPESKGSLTYSPALGARTDQSGATSDPDSGSHGTAVPTIDPVLQQSVPSLGLAAQELVRLLEAARAEGDTETVRKAEEALARLQATSVDVSETMEKITGLLGEQPTRFSPTLDFGTNSLADVDPGLLSQSLFGDRPDGFSPDHGAAPAHAGAINWPPWGPTRQRSMWSRMARSNIAIPLLLVAVIAVSAATYKVYKHVTRPNIVPAVTSTGISSDGSVKVVDGSACRAGQSTTTVQLAAAQVANGSYYIATTGTVSNGGTATLHNLAVRVLITYADGAQTTQLVPANKGQAIPGKSSKGWFGSAVITDGSVPPVGVAITGIESTPALPACA